MCIRDRCSSAPLLTPDVPAGVANNMAALFVTGAVVGIAAVVIARRQGGVGGVSTADRLGIALTLVVLGGGVVWFFVARDAFVAHGHDASAIPMFLAIVGVVWLNARGVRTAVRQGSAPATYGRYVAIYRTIAVAMLVALAATVAINLATSSAQIVLWVEVVLITLFAVFWLVQTTELWNRGLRRT